MCAKSSSGVRIYLQAASCGRGNRNHLRRQQRNAHWAHASTRPAIRSRPSRANLDGEFSSGPTGYAGKGVRPSSPAAQRVRPRVKSGLDDESVYVKIAPSER